MGTYSRELGLITIRSGMTDAQVFTTLVHEVLHHIWAEAGLRGVLGNDLEERIVASLEGGVFSFIVDNPTLIGLMMPKKKKQKKKKTKVKVKKGSY